MISVVTPTCDRPAGIALAESWMARQTLQPAEWIIADGGSQPVACTLGQIHIHDPRAPGVGNFANNLRNGIGAAKGDIVIVWEDDDWYAPTHLQRLVETFQQRPEAQIAGDGTQRYYNVAKRLWKQYKNVGASMCQTAIRRAVLPKFEMAIRIGISASSYGIDAQLWKSIPRQAWAVTDYRTCVGIKGLPGRIGLGVGHRPGHDWAGDPALVKLREWVGEDAETYADLPAILAPS